MRRFLRAAMLASAATLVAACSGTQSVPATPGAAPLGNRAVALGTSRAVAGANGFSAMRASFTHSLVCDNGTLIAAFAQAYGITQLFVPIGGDDISSLLAGNPTTVKNLNAMTAVARVFVVTGDNAWISTPTTVPQPVTQLAQIGAKYPQIAGILYAIDPVQLPAWNTNQRRTLVSNYLTLEATILSGQGTAFAATDFTADIAFATSHVGSATGPTVLEQMQTASGLTGIDLVVPGASASAQVSNAGSSISQIVKPFTIEASTSKYDKGSYYGQSASSLQSNLTQLAQSVSSQNSHFTSVEVNGWNDLYNSLQSILPQPPVYSGQLAGGPLVPATGTTYLGGFVNPTHSGQTPAQTLAFEQQIGRTLAFNMHFYQWTDAFPGTAEADDVARGRVPLIAWNCGDSDANVASGADDVTIKARADAVKAFGSTVFVRWFWEMNLDDTNNPPRTQCWDANTDLPLGYFSPQNYIAAWQHVRRIFAQEGATNVVWLWCIANAHGGPSQYYPGDDQVDWVGMDDYDTTDAPSMATTLNIEAMMLSQFQEKPLMVTETGAHAQTQTQYLGSAVQVLQQNFPWVRAVGYLDAIGTHQNWALTSSGVQAFTAFANDPYMSAMASATARTPLR